MTYFGIAVRPDGSYEVYATDDGIRRTAIPTGVFGKPRDAIRYADMRAANISPLREEPDGGQPPRPLTPALREAANPLPGSLGR